MAGQYLQRNPTSTGNRKVHTWSGWVKQNKLNTVASNNIWYVASAGNSEWRIFISNTGNLIVNDYIPSPAGIAMQSQTARLLRDHGSWFHLLVSVDTTQSAGGDRIKIYLDGVRITEFSSTNYGSQNHETRMNAIGEVNYLGQNTIGGGTYQGYCELFDVFMVDGQALTPEVFGFYKDGNGYVSAGSTQATDFRNGQWVPRTPREIKNLINDNGGFGVNGFYLPMNDSSNFGADFHTTPNSIIKLKGEDLPQPRNGAPTTTDAYVSQLREEEGTLGFDGVVKFDGTGDQLTIPESTDFQLASSAIDFTIEAWVYGINFSGAFTTISAVWDQSTGDQWLFSVDTSGVLGFVWEPHSNSVNFISGGELRTYTWNHVAVTRSGNTFRLFLNGAETASGTNTGTTTNNTQLQIGKYASVSDSEWEGFISNLRIIKGTALYTSDFTPPTEPLTNVTNTKLLCCNSSSSATAATVSPGTITANGNVISGTNELSASLVLAVPGISTATGANLITNGTFDSNTAGWTSEASATLSSDNGRLKVLTTNTSYGSAIQVVTGLTIGQRYTFQVDMIYGDASFVSVIATTAYGGSVNQLSGWQSADYVWRTSFVADATSLKIDFQMASLSGVYGLWDNVILKAEDAPRDYSADIRGSGSNKTLTAYGNAGVGYEIPSYYGSALSFDGTDDYFDAGSSSDFDFGSGDFTVEYWQNANSFSGTPGLGIWDGTNDQRSWLVYQNSSALPRFYVNTDGTGAGSVYVQASIALSTNQWNHFCMERNGSNLVGYVNGVCVGVNATLGTQSIFTPADPFWIGRWSSNYINGQIQDLRVYKGIAKYKGGFDVPKPYTPVGFEGESWRQVPDTTANNFATLNSIDAIENVTLTEGNLHWSAPNSGAVQGGSCRSTINITSGKWYWEVQNTLAARYHIGLLATNAALPPSDAGLTTTNWAFRSDGYAVHNNLERVYGSDCDDTTGITVMVAFDSDTGKLYFGKNGTWFGNGNPALGTSEPAFSNIPVTGGVSPFLNRRTGTNSAAINFGQNPSFGGRVTAGTYTDSNGKGLFKYQPPEGFLALCEDNLPTPAIKDPGNYFKTVLWTGDGNVGRSITGVGFKPDLVWIKSRSFANNHHLFDVIRGPNNVLRTSTTGAESNPGNVMTSFNSDGFTVGEDGGNNATNDNGNTFVAWCWKAGGAAVSNTDGTLPSQVSANQTAGFSIVSYTGTGANATVGHGLAKTPYFVIVKKRPATDNWIVWHNSFADGDSFLRINTTGAVDSSSTVWNSTAPTDSVISIGTNSVVNQSSNTYIAYCWAEIEGYSKFGTYVGNGDANGPFVYCGFRPAWVMVKRTDSTGGDWAILDSSRASENNTVLTALSPNDNRGQGLFGFNADYCSNGFKLRVTDSFSNASGGTYAFFALAESPFQTANAK